MADEPTRDLWDPNERLKAWNDAFAQVQANREQDARITELRGEVAEYRVALRANPNDPKLLKQLEDAEEAWLAAMRERGDVAVKELGEAKQRRLELAAEKNPGALTERIAESDSPSERRIAVEALFRRGMHHKLSAPEYAKAQEKAETLKDVAVNGSSQAKRMKAVGDLTKLLGEAEAGPVGWFAIALQFLGSKYGITILILWALGLALIAVLILALVQGPFQKLFGTGPEEVVEVGNQQDMASLRLATCLAQEHSDLEESGEPLPESCIKILEGEAGEQGALATSKATVEQAITRFNTLKDSEQKQAILDAVTKMKAELNAMNPRAPYNELKPHVVEYQVQQAKFADAVKKLVSNCDLSSWGEPSSTGLYQVPTSGVAGIALYATGAPNGRAHQFVSGQTACYLTALGANWSAQGGTIEIGDASYANGSFNTASHGQHGGGGNVDIWVSGIMPARLDGSAYSSDKAVALAKLIRDLGGVELFASTSGPANALNQTYQGYPLVNANESHDDHWHICVHTCQ